MPNGIEEMTDIQNPTNPPTEFASKNLMVNATVEQVSAKRIDEHYPEPVPDIKPEPKQEATIDYVKPMMTELNSEQPVDIGHIPGVKEVYIKPTTTKADEQKAAFVDPKTGKPLDFNMRRFLQETMNGGMINRLVKRYDLEGIDLEKEFELVQKKESRLSASKRKAVVALYNMRKQQKQLLADIGKELLKNENPTDDDLRNLLDSVEDAHTNQEEVTVAVAENILQQAINQANKPADEKQEETVATIEEVMESARVEYTPNSTENPVPHNTNDDGSIPLTIG